MLAVSVIQIQRVIIRVSQRIQISQISGSAQIVHLVLNHFTLQLVKLAGRRQHIQINFLIIVIIRITQIIQVVVFVLTVIRLAQALALANIQIQLTGSFRHIFVIFILFPNINNFIVFIENIHAQAQALQFPN